MPFISEFRLELVVEEGGGYLGGVLVCATKDSGTSTAISRVLET